MQNARLNDELRRRMQVSETLLRVMRAVSSELNLDQLLAKIINMTCEVMGADRAFPTEEESVLRKLQAHLGFETGEAERLLVLATR